MALAQTEEIARRLKAFGTEVEIVKFETTGDIDQTGKLLPHGGKGGAFVAQIREAVLAGELHAAMHSLKDMPGNEDTPGLVIGATLSRDPPGDVLVLRPGLSFDEFARAGAKGFKVGTNAVRRAAYARRLFPDVEVIHYRGAADTRVRKLDNLREAEAAGWRRGRSRRCADHGALGTGARRACRVASPTSFRLPTCCRRRGRALSRSNAPRAISGRCASCPRSTIPPHMPAPMPSARCCGC